MSERTGFILPFISVHYTKKERKDEKMATKKRYKDKNLWVIVLKMRLVFNGRD